MLDPWAARQIGRHTIILEKPDILRITILGDVSPGEAAGILAADRECIAHLGYALTLIDATRVGRVSPETRRRVGEVMKSEDDYLGCSALYGTSTQSRILFSLMINAVNLFLSRPVQVRFYKTESESLVWLSQQREALIERAARRAHGQGR